MLSLDLEHGGEYCGIIQLSAEFITIRLKEHGKASNKDALEEWGKHSDTFNAYVNPGENALWDDSLTAVHGLRRTDPRIVNAHSIHVVWAQFVSWFNELAKEFGSVLLVAWNGENCDLKWLWKICQSPNSPCSFPEKLQFFMDPWKVIKHYTSCAVHPSKSKIDCLSLGSVYTFLLGGEEIEGAHDSLADCQAQSIILMHKSFIPFINRKASIAPITQIFKAKEVAQWKRAMEPILPVHSPWIELTDDVNFAWEPSNADSYGGPNGGPKAGPTSNIMEIARRAPSLAEVFFGILPISFFQYVSKMTDKYCYKDWVVEKEQVDSDGNVKKKKMLKPCTADTPGARHRVDCESRYSYKITPGFILAWFGLLILQGAHFGSDKRSAKKMWRSPPEGFSLPYVRNSMTSTAYEFMRAYVHFCDNDKRKPKGHRSYDAFFKICYAMDTIMTGIRKCWNPGMRVTIDESMVRYMGRAVDFVQYMPAKPIKHGIKIYAVYLGKKKDDRTTLEVVDDLLKDADLLGVRGRELFTDNYYTSVALADHLFVKYGWTICGTMTPTDKKTRSRRDVPFLKLSNGARNAVPRGWYREAVLEMKAPNGKRFFLQCTT
jgi:hypothetical protein